MVLIGSNKQPTNSEYCTLWLKLVPMIIVWTSRVFWWHVVVLFCFFVESISQHNMLPVQDFLLDDCGVCVPDSPEL